MPPVNWHEVIDERSLELHAVLAELLRNDAAKLDLVIAWIEKFLADPDYSAQSKVALSEWLRVIQSGGLTAVLPVLVDRGSNGQRMRQSSPFAVIMPQDERKRIFARYEARRPRTHPASV